MIQDFIAKLSEKEKKVFYAALIIVMLAFLDRVFLGPVLDKIKTVNESIQEQQTGIDRDLRFLSYKGKINKDNDALKKYIPAKIQQEDDINTEFFSRIEKIANHANVTLIKSNPAAPKKEKDFEEYYASVDLSGNLKDVIGFIHAINSSDDLFKVVKFNLTPKKGEVGSVNASLTIAKLIIQPDTATAQTSSVKEAPKKLK